MAKAMRVFLLCLPPATPDEPLKPSLGAVIVDDQGRALPHTFSSPTLAVAFLESVERAGVKLYHDMNRGELNALVALFYDAYKR